MGSSVRPDPQRPARPARPAVENPFLRLRQPPDSLPVPPSGPPVPPTPDAANPFTALRQGQAPAPAEGFAPDPDLSKDVTGQRLAQVGSGMVPFSDEMARGVAWVVGKLFGEEYDADKMVDQLRTLQREGREQRPVESFGLNALGGIAGGAAAAPRGIVQAAAAQTLGRTAAQGARIGAASGAAFGAGEADGDLSDRLSGGVAGGVAGGVLGAAVPVAAAGARRVGSWAADVAGMRAPSTAAAPVPVAQAPTAAAVFEHPPVVPPPPRRANAALPVPAPAPATPPVVAGRTGTASDVVTPLTVRQRIGQAIGVQSADDRARELAARVVSPRDGTVQDVIDRLDLIPEETPVTLADDALGGRKAAMLTRAARAMGETGRDQIDEAYEARGRDAAQRLVTAVERVSGVKPSDDVRDVLAKQAKTRATRAAKNWDAAYKSKDLTSPAVLKAFKSPAVQKAYQLASQQVSIDEAPLPALPGAPKGGHHGAPAPKPSLFVERPAGLEPTQITASLAQPDQPLRAVSVRALDQTKRFLDRVVRKGAESEDGISRDEARRILNVLKPALDAAKKEAPAYRKALAVYAKDMTPDNAIRLAANGDKRLKLPPFVKATDKEVAAAMKGLDRDGQQMYRLAVVQHARQLLQSRGEGRDAVVALLEPSTMNRAKWRALLGSDTAVDDLMGAVRQERGFRKTAGVITGGSQTDANLAAQDLLTENVGETVVDAVRSPMAAASHWAGRLVQGRLRGVSRETADALAPMMTTGSQGGAQARAELRRLLEQLARAQADAAARQRPRPSASASLAGGMAGRTQRRP